MYTCDHSLSSCVKFQLLAFVNCHLCKVWTFTAVLFLRIKQLKLLFHVLSNTLLAPTFSDKELATIVKDHKQYVSLLFLGCVFFIFANFMLLERQLQFYWRLYEQLEKYFHFLLALSVILKSFRKNMKKFVLLRSIHKTFSAKYVLDFCWNNFGMYSLFFQQYFA